MNKIIATLFLWGAASLVGCSGSQSGSDGGVDSAEAPPTGYTHLMEGAFVHPYEELSIERQEPWQIHFESTNQAYRSDYSGVFWINQKKVDIQGVHWPQYGKEIPCANVLRSLPMASNSVVMETVIFNDAYQETADLNQPHHKVAFVFPNGIEGNALVHICLTSFENSTTLITKSLHTLSYERTR